MISDDRIKHIFGVARLMKQFCIENNFDEKYCEEMFSLGMLHDIGYEFSEHADHNFVGGELLKRQNYKYYNEVMFHGVPDSTYSSKELDILNFADMHIDGKGNFVSFDERLDDIKNRRGEKSDAFINSKKIIDNLIFKGYK